MSDNTKNSAFDAEWYIAEYPDVALTGMDPFEHYQWIGQKLGRLPRKVGGNAMSSSSRKGSAIEKVQAGASYQPKTGDRLARFIAIEAGQSTQMPGMSPLMQYIWKSRADLQNVFDCSTLAGRTAFADWFTRSFHQEYGVPSYENAVPAATFSDEGVNLIGYAHAPSGRGEDVRMVAHALAANNVSFALRDIPTGSSHSDTSVKEWIGDKQPYRTNIFHVNADMFPIEVLKYGQGHHNIGYWAWELADCPPIFDDALGLVDEIWGISNFVSDAFRRRADVPVHTIPLAVRVPRLTGAERSKSRFGLEEKPFTFLFTFDAFSYLDRKNPVDVVRAFKKAFPVGDEDARLVLKTHNVDKVVTSSYASFLWKELVKEIGEDPRIKIIDRTLKRDEVFALTAACDAFVSLHRSEGFGRNLAEAMLYGRPVISTGYSGSNEFINGETAVPIEYSLIPVGEGAYPNGDGQFWAQPDIDHAAWAMRRLKNDSQWRDDIARSGKQFVADNFNEKVIGKRIAERIESLQILTKLQVPQNYDDGHSNDLNQQIAAHVKNKKTVLFTVVSQNYMAFARTVMQSVREQHPEFSLFICLVDEGDDLEIPEQDDFKIVRIRDMDLPNFLDMRLRYDVMELNTAVKPFFIEWVYNKTDVDKVIYFDPDLFLYKPIKHILDSLDSGSSVVLTPHVNRPIQPDGFSPSDHDIMQSGVFNLGFIATRRTDETHRFIRWWAKQLETASISDVRNNLFTDQRWCDFAPCFLKDLKVLHHEGHNVAYWNLDQRVVKRDENGHVMVNGDPLIFFHFSGFHPRRLEQVSKHQTRFTWDRLSQTTRELMQAYGERLLANGYETATNVPYSYDDIDGLNIRPVMRQIYRNAYPQPHVFRSEKEARDRLVELCLHASGPPPADGGEPFSELTMQIYRIRPDVQTAFPITSQQGATGFRSWLNHSIKNEYGIDMDMLTRFR
jgi:glycosyltransferase involved in cell wall biosynthesis